MDSDWESIQSSHIEQLSGYDLLVMVLRSSLALDMAVLNTPAISFFGDPSGVLARRKTHLDIVGKQRIGTLESIPVETEYDSLLSRIKHLLQDQGERQKVVDGVLLTGIFVNQT